MRVCAQRERRTGGTIGATIEFLRPGRIFHQPAKDTDMNWDRIEGNWKQFKGNVKQQWGKLTDDQLDVIAGKRDHLVGKIQESYGISKDETEKQLADWQKKLKDHQ
jgi:uncharacterized protein YjbJ (UPF0337 family)